MKCPKCNQEIDRLYVFEPAHLLAVLTQAGEQPPEDFQAGDFRDKDYTCPQCGETVTVDEEEACEMLGAELEQTFHWSYRGGEITGTVKAATAELALDKVARERQDLHGDMFEIEEEE